MPKRHRIQFPKSGVSKLNQDEAYFYLLGSGGQRKIRFHDYDEIYQVPGLYEQVFYDRLKCTSPVKVATILESAVRQSQDNFTELRVLDLGAGNGMMGEELKKHGVSRLIGVDIIPEAYEATVRDRPGLYDAYYVEDLRLLMKKRKKILHHGNVTAWSSLLPWDLEIYLPMLSLRHSILSLTRDGWHLTSRNHFLTKAIRLDFHQ